MRRVSSQIVAATGLALAALALPGCDPSKRMPDDAGAIVDPNNLPSYEAAAARYNSAANRLGQFWASAVVRLAYVDAEGKRREDQGEGRVQLAQPASVALNIGKLGETYIWIGADQNRYWWLDLTGSDRIAFTGRHENYARSRARALGVIVPPQDLITLLGIAPLPERGGAVQASSDGRLIGLTAYLRDGRSKQRVWVDPASGLPVQVELFGEKAEDLIVASLSAHQPVSIRGDGNPPQVATRVKISHAASNSLITLDLTDMEDGQSRIRPEAFNLGVLLKQLRVDKLYDLDSPRKP